MLKVRSAYLTRSGHSDGTGPIVVHVGHFVGKTLHMVGLKIGIIICNNVVGRCDCALIDVLRDEEKIIPILASDAVIDHSTRLRVAERLIIISLYIRESKLINQRMLINQRIYDCTLTLVENILVLILFCTTMTHICGLYPVVKHERSCSTSCSATTGSCPSDTPSRNTKIFSGR